MRDRLRRLVRGAAPDRPPVVHVRPGAVVSVCHPAWRGVRAAALAHRDDTVIETPTPDAHARDILAVASDCSASCLVVHGWPPGSDLLVRDARSRGLRPLVVLHSSPAQHGAEVGEAAVADEVYELAKAGIVERVGFVKAGVAEAMAALGWPAAHTPNRSPIIEDVARQDLGPGLHVGIFGEPFWRKNVVTQMCAAALLDDVTVHLLNAPSVGYLERLRTVVHGVLPRHEFLSLQASVDLNLYVTLSECHPMTPLESYLSGVPCLLSRTSEVFASDRQLWELTTTDRADDPSAIAEAAQHLLRHRHRALRHAVAWADAADRAAISAWRAFVA